MKNDNFGKWFTDILSHPEKINEELSHKSSVCNDFAEELNGLYNSYANRLAEIKKNYRVYRDDNGKHKVILR